jgi:uncharacterized protein YdhG (YjbR/CyaY superfamily)
MDHGTFVIAFNMSKQHMSFTPEAVYYDLLKRIIEFNIAEKAECITFFRK